MNDEERKMWVMNDEALYNWWKESNQKLASFVKDNRQTLTSIINKKLGNVV